MTFIARHLKHPKRQKICKFDRYLQGRVSKSKLSEEVRSFWPIGWAMLKHMKLNEIEKKFSSVIAAFEDLLANEVPRTVKAVTTACDIPNS